MAEELRCGWCGYPLGPKDDKDNDELVFCDVGCKSAYEKAMEEKIKELR